MGAEAWEPHVRAGPLQLRPWPMRLVREAEWPVKDGGGVGDTDEA